MLLTYTSMNGGAKRNIHTNYTRKEYVYFIVDFLLEQTLLKGQGSTPHMLPVDFAYFVEFAYFFGETRVWPKCYPICTP